MTDADRFLATIIATPEDDAPRLVFADWLEEHGDADRAEFIRLQCSLARDGANFAREARAAELLTANRPRWIVPDMPGRQLFRRGFVEFVHLSADDFLEHADRLATAAPIVGLRLSAAAGRTSRLVLVDWLKRVQSLEILNDGLGPRLREWFQPGKFPELVSLSLRNNRLWSDYVAILAELSPNLPKLERLDLSGNPLGDEGLALLANAEPLRGLRSLILRSDEIEYDYAVHESGATALARSATMNQLAELNLDGQHIGDAGFQAIVNSPVARSLERLDVSRNGIGESGSEWAEALVASPHLGRLREVNFAVITVDTNAAKLLARWTHLATGCTVRFDAPNWTNQARCEMEQSEFRDRLLVIER